MDLEFTINNQTLKRTDSEKPVDWSNEYLQCSFDFKTDDWEPMGKFAIFKTGKLNFRVAINDDECIVPFDALQYNQFALTLYGIDGDTRITTNLVYIKLGKSGFVTEYDESSYFNPDMTEELLDLVEQKVYISVFDETVTNINESISELGTNKTVTITKQDVADTGYFSTYVINQGGTALSPKINIPKDYLLKSASIKQCSEKGVPLPDLNVGDYYFDWVLNTSDGTGDETHLYLNANVLTDVYEPDNTSIVINDKVISVKTGVFALIDEVYSKSEVDELIHTLNNNIKLNGTSEIIQTDENVELYAYCKADGMPMLNKKVHFFKIEED